MNQVGLDLLGTTRPMKWNFRLLFGPVAAAVLGPSYGLVQRMLFGAWFGWCAGLGVMLFNRGGGTPPAE